MPATATVNGLTVVHKTSNGISQAFPDVCKTPAPPSPSPVPIPYPNIAMSANAADTATSVKADGQPIMLSTSKYATSTGDEAGTLLGVVSNRIKGTANPMMYSFDVKAEGKNVFRQLDLMLQNGNSNPVNTPPGPNIQPPLPPPVPLGVSREWKIIEVKWSDAKKKCGDRVGIHTTTQNYPNGVPIAHVVHRTGIRRLHALRTGRVASDAVDVEWITVNGRWRRPPTKLKVKAHGSCKVKESSNELEIEKPAEHFERVYVSAAVNRVEVMTKVALPVPVLGPPFRIVMRDFIVPSGRFVSGEYGYDLSIKQGVFQIHCKMKIVPQAGVRTGKRLRRAKKAWKREVERIWDRKWKEHRTACLRGDACGCPGGCCLFPIRVKCSFVSSGQHVTVNLWPGAPTNSGGAGANPDWWDQSNWYERLGGLEGNGNVVHAHEFGHSIGMEDEYAGGSTIAAYYDVPGSIMQSGVHVMKQHFERHPAIGVSIHTRFLAAANDAYKLLPI